MIYFLIALGVVAFFGVAGWAMWTMMNNSWKDGIWRVAAGVEFALLVLLIWLISYGTNNSPPCAKYETQMMYNAATKTMMPAQFCVQEGTWVK